MFYDALKNDHGLPHNPLNALVAPRPIGWISTVDGQGIRNLAPYSYFSLLASGPGLVGFSSAGLKDSQRNAEATGEFVCNFASYELRGAMNQSSARYDATIDEFERAGLTASSSCLVAAPRVSCALAALECKYIKTVALPTRPERDAPQDHAFALIIGMVVGVYIADHMIEDGIVQTAKMRPLSRLGYMDYGVTDSAFEILRPNTKT